MEEKGKGQAKIIDTTHYVNCQQKMDFGATVALYGCGEDMGWAQHGM